MEKGKIIIFEGPDFSGKSTQIKLLKPELKINNILYTREPGSYLPASMKECEKIRNYILNNELTVEEEAKLFAESRLEHTLEMIEYANKGYHIICDRYIVSSLAYQGYAQNLGKDKIYELNKQVLDLLDENNMSLYCLSFYLDNEEWNKRKSIRLNQEAADSIESKDIHQKVYEFYTDLSIYFDYTDKLNMFTRSINANGNKYEIHKEVLSVIKILTK